MTRSGLFGPWEPRDLGDELPPGINPGKVNPWGLSSFQFFPNFAIPIWERAGTTRTSSGRRRTTRSSSRGTSVSLPAKSASERVGREMAAVAFKEYRCRTPTPSKPRRWALETARFDRFPLNDQEVLVRNFHQVVGDWVGDFELEPR